MTLWSFKGQVLSFIVLTTSNVVSPVRIASTSITKWIVCSKCKVHLVTFVMSYKIWLYICMKISRFVKWVLIYIWSSYPVSSPCICHGMAVTTVCRWSTRLDCVIWLSMRHGLHSLRSHFVPSLNNISISCKLMCSSRRLYLLNSTSYSLNKLRFENEKKEGLMMIGSEFAWQRLYHSC